MKRKSVTFWDVLKKYGFTTVVASFSYYLGASTVIYQFDVDVEVSGWIVIISLFIIVVAFLVWVITKGNSKHCTVCYDEFFPPSEYKSSELCQNCLLEKIEPLKK